MSFNPFVFYNKSLNSIVLLVYQTHFIVPNFWWGEEAAVLGRAANTQQSRDHLHWEKSVQCIKVHDSVSKSKKAKYIERALGSKNHSVYQIPNAKYTGRRVCRAELQTLKQSRDRLPLGRISSCRTPRPLCTAAQCLTKGKRRSMRTK